MKIPTCPKCDSWLVELKETDEAKGIRTLRFRCGAKCRTVPYVGYAREDIKWALGCPKAMELEECKHAFLTTTETGVSCCTKCGVTEDYYGR